MSYDEDLSRNPIFQRLESKFPTLLAEAPFKSFLFCIPKNAIAQEIDIQDGDILNYVLKPLNSSPESGIQSYQTLTKKRVEVRGRNLHLKQGFPEARIARILFEETFYNIEDKSYQVLCVDQPFEGKPTSQVILQPEELLDPNECYKFLTVGGGQNIIGIENYIQMELSNFLHLSRFRQGVSLRHMLDMVSAVITRLVMICLKYSAIHRKYCEDKSYIDILRLAVENVVYFEIYPKLFKVVCGLVSKEDGELNKVTRNLAHIEATDLEIKSQFCFNFPKAKRELAKMTSLRTPYQKLWCMHETFQILSQPTPHSNEPMNADDILPLLVLLIIHSDIACWYGNISFMENFYLSPLDKEKYKYCISSVEAAVEFLRSGNLKIDRFRKALFIQNEGTQVTQKNTTTECSIDNFFELIYQDNFSKIQDTLDSLQNSHLKELCHPLCTCDRCQTHLATAHSHRNVGAVTLCSCDDWGRGPLHIAALVGNEKVMELLLNYGAQPISQDYHGSSPLHMACQKGHIKATMLLVDRGAPTNLQDNSGNTPLHLASLYGHDACVKALVFQSPARKLNPYNEKGDTPLHIAARWGYEDIVILLLESGASWEARNKDKEVPKDCAQNSAIQTVFKDYIFRTRGADDMLYAADYSKRMTLPSLKRSSTFSSPMGFRRSNNVFRTTTSLQIKKNHMIEREMNLVFDAISTGKENLVREMMGWEKTDMTCSIDTESSCELNNSTCNGVCHPLCKCIKCTAEQNTETGLTIAMASKSGQTFLHMACLHGNYSLSKLFIIKGADVNTRTYAHKHTPLHLAAQYNHSGVVKLLIENGAEIHAKDVNGCTPLHYSATNGHTDSALSLLDNGASPNENDIRNNIPLHNAAKWGHTVMVECLLEHGSLVDKYNADSLMPIQITQSDEVITILESYQNKQKRVSARRNSLIDSLNTESDITSSMNYIPVSPVSVHDNIKTVIPDPPIEDLRPYSKSIFTIPQLTSKTKVEAEVASTYLTAGPTTSLT
ncbi:Ankyrin repeat domain-containing protein 27-like [Oopsacas minuta]|uniref:Ankyrin repeat domain-containing protein 27-like n=1 Tax=Oopsacas minuta TaxID=111878 RepID=A0AAV7KAL8_9METZ|nr:Ankyrin repeat domain-containing protein 27-like [Oopsacas minuta]